MGDGYNIPILFLDRNQKQLSKNIDCVIFMGVSLNNNFDAFLENKPKYLVSGFCLGMQTMNVATGGTLIQVIPAEIFGVSSPEATDNIGRLNIHRNYWQEIEEDSLFMGITLLCIKFTSHPFFGETIKIPKHLEPQIFSSRHQATEKLGKRMEITAVSSDEKIVKGLAKCSFPNVFAVQFLPEVPALNEDLYLRKFHPEDELMSYYNIIGRHRVKFHKNIGDIFPVYSEKQKK